VTPPVVLSASSVATYLRCGQQWYYAYIMNYKEPPNLKKVVGIATHRAVELNMEQKITTKVDLPTEQVLDAFADAFDKESEDVEPDERESPGEAKDSGIAITRLYHETVGPPIQPYWVERQVQYAVDGVPFTGILDLVEERTDPVMGSQHFVLRDVKTTAQTPSRQRYAIQMTGYAVAVKHETGQDSADVILDFLVRTKLPKYVPLYADVTKNTIRQFSDVVGQVMNGINAGNFPPNGLVGTACSWCGYRDICPAFKEFSK